MLMPIVAVLSFFSFCATLTSEARGCKLLHKHRCAVQTWSLHQKKRKKSTKESREPKANGCKQLIAERSEAKMELASKKKPLWGHAPTPPLLVVLR